MQGEVVEAKKGPPRAGSPFNEAISLVSGETVLSKNYAFSVMVDEEVRVGRLLLMSTDPPKQTFNNEISLYCQEIKESTELIKLLLNEDDKGFYKHLVMNGRDMYLIELPEVNTTGPTVDITNTFIEYAPKVRSPNFICKDFTTQRPSTNAGDLSPSLDTVDCTGDNK